MSQARMGDQVAGSPLELLRRQRSHMLVVLSSPQDSGRAAFLDWYQGPFRAALTAAPDVTRVQQFQEHEVDVTTGRHARLPYAFLTLCDLSLDGGDRAQVLIEAIAAEHVKSGAAKPPATWLYFPASEQVGRATPDAPLITVACANAKPGFESVFREFYATRHLRHALNIPALVSGQCFERAKFQMPGAMTPDFEVLAIYEQTGSVESIIEAFQTLPPGTIAFPGLDTTSHRFAEASYRRIS